MAFSNTISTILSNRTHWNPEDPLQCLPMLRGRRELISSYNSANSNVSSRPCLAC
ncbi:hypothetical protein BT93_E1317 [Corymbia citriodora subsp. variegata]|nr:hypothetical protein BT93_E1317 [Corymbia citriodora subsp. variegata]